MLRILSETVVYCAILFAGGQADPNRLNRLIRKAGDVVGMKLDFSEMVTERRMLFKFHSIKAWSSIEAHVLKDFHLQNAGWSATDSLYRLIG